MALLDALCAELHQQVSASIRKQLKVVDDEMFAPHEVDEQGVEAFEADRLVLQDEGNVVGRDKGICKTQAHQHAARRAVHQAQGGFEHGDAGAFGADQGAGNVEAIFRQQFVQVVSGDAAWNFRETFADQRGVAVANFFQAGVDFSAASARLKDGSEFIVAGGAHFEHSAVVEQHAHGLNIVDSLAAHQRVDAAGVVADHTAERAAVVGGGIGGKGQTMFLGGFAHAIEHNAGLDAGLPGVGIQLQDVIEILGKIQHDGDVAALAGEAGAGAAREDGSAECAADGDGCFDVCRVERQHQTDGNLTIIGGVGGIEGATAGVEADFTSHRLTERSLEFAVSEELFMRVRRFLFDQYRKTPSTHFRPLSFGRRCGVSAFGASI